jgi:hypothetical protein
LVVLLPGRLGLDELVRPDAVPLAGARSVLRVAAVWGGVSRRIFLESDAIDNAQTYAQLAAAFQAALDAQTIPGLFIAAVGDNFRVYETRSGVAVSGQQIKINTVGAITFSTPRGSGWIATGVVPADSGLYTTFVAGPPTISRVP